MERHPDSTGQPAPEPAPEHEAGGQEMVHKSRIVITHSRAEGTLIEGSKKGDGVYELVRPHGFRYFPSLGCLGIPQSRDRAAQRWKINPAADALRRAGHDVEIRIDEDKRRSFKEAEEERYRRAEERAELRAASADRAASASSSLWEASKQGLPEGGEPIKVGHHSERRHRNALARSEQRARKSIAEAERAERLTRLADAAEHYKAFRRNPQVTLRRIERLEADRRRVERLLEQFGGMSPEELVSARAVAEDLAEWKRRREELTEEIDYWRGVVKEAEAQGFKVWGSADFTKGDFVRARGRWYEVLRVNAKSVTVPGGPDIQRVITRENRRYSWDDRLPYDEVTGRMSGEEMRRKLAEAKAEAGAAEAGAGR